MAFVAEPQRNTGDLISDNTWNQALVDNPNFLKGLAGQVDIDDDINPTVDAFAVAGNKSNLGLGGDPASAKRWQDVFGVRLTANRYSADQQRRTVILKWESLDVGAADAFVDHHMVKTVVVGADAVEAGVGQILMGVDRTVSVPISAQLTQRDASIAPVGVALANRWAGQRSPFLRIEFSFSSVTGTEQIWMGFRQTPGVLIPASGAEDLLGFQFSAGLWLAAVGNSTGKDTLDFTSSVAAGDRQVFEAAIFGSDADAYINGTFIGSFNPARIPGAGLMQFHMLTANVTIVGAGRMDLTVGETVLQEDRV